MRLRQGHNDLLIYSRLWINQIRERVTITLLHCHNIMWRFLSNSTGEKVQRNFRANSQEWHTMRYL